MRHAPEQSTPLNQHLAEIRRPTVPEQPAGTESPVSQEEVSQLRQEKLEAIRLAIARGDYDSDELLEKSMDLLLQRLEQSNGLLG
jgi:anti-sigma28 factor (negative regulator of flagellin synthesis)